MEDQEFRNIFADNEIGNPFFNNDRDNNINFNLNNNFNDNLNAEYENNIENSPRDDPTSVWIFGYGSLCWYPGFSYNKCITGYIRGFVRRFWQGNITHRGTSEKPGRVATLVEDKEGITWGCAYKITGDSALAYLKQRECTLGGYVTLDMKFFPRLASEDATEITGEAIPVLVYIATSENDHWLGEDCPKKIAEQIATCSGPTGHNAEYLLKLVQFMRNEIPGVVDEHLFELEHHLNKVLIEKKIPLISVMGRPAQRIRRDSHEDGAGQPITFEFTSRVPEKKLRCLNI